MTEFGKRLREIRAKMELSQEEFANLLGTSKQVISRYETGQRAPKITIANEYAIKLGVPLSKLTGDDGQLLPANVTPISQSHVQRVPLLGDIAAGQPITAQQDYETFVAVDSPVKADFALRVKGDSMKPLYLDGDVVYLRQQDDVSDGQVAAVIMEDTATLKRVYHVRNGVQLVSENRDYAPMLFTLDEYSSIRILGLVVGFTRMYGASEHLRGVTKGMPHK